MLVQNFTIASLLLILNLSACNNSSSLDSLSPLINNTQANDNWLVTGAVTRGDFQNAEVVAIGIDGTKFRSAITQGNFGIELPGNATYALHFMPKSVASKNIAISASDFLRALPDSSESGSTGAKLTFEESPEVGTRETLRLPRITRGAVLNLGEIDIQGERAYPAINPALNLDFDKDGISDFKDPDDQNDDLPDNKQIQQFESVDVCTNTKTGGVTQKVNLSELLEILEQGANIGSCGAPDLLAPQDTQLSDLAIAPESNLDDNMPEELPPATDIAPPPEIPVRNQDIIIEPTEDDDDSNNYEDDDDSNNSEDDDDSNNSEDDDDSNNSEDDDDSNNSEDDDDSNNSEDDDDAQ